MQHRDPFFCTYINQLIEKAGDWRVVVVRLSDGTTRQEEVSGEWSVADEVARRLKTELA